MTPLEHSGDCTIWATLDNRNPTDGICICGAGLKHLRQNGCVCELYSDERLKLMGLDKWKRQNCLTILPTLEERSGQ